MVEEAVSNKNIEECDHNENKPFFLIRKVKRHKDILLKERLRTLIASKGMKEKDFYKSIGISKQHWYELSWGMYNIPLALKVKIAQALGSDTSVIWKQEDIDGIH